MIINECTKLFDIVKEYYSYISGLESGYVVESGSRIAEDLVSAVKVISDFVYELMPEKDSGFIRYLSEEESIEVSDLQNRLKAWIAETGDDIDVLAGCFVNLDRDFERMMLTVERCKEEVLVKRLLSRLAAFAQEFPSSFERLISVYNDFAHFWGEFDPAENKYDHFTNGIHAVKEHTEDIRWLYGAVYDYRSKKVIFGLVRFWLELDFSYKNTLKENNYADYFDLDVFRDKITEDEIFVDCGAYTGDTAKAYFDNFRSCRKMFLYDMLSANLSKAKETLAGHNEIIYRNAGVGSPEQKGMKIPVNNAETSTFSLDECGDIYDPEGKNAGDSGTEVELVTLDEDIKEKITFLKMDIEGSEISALLGAKEHIINDRPKLAICTYHHYEHLWEIPKLIRSMNPDYKLYIRYNGAINGTMASEHVVLAVLD